LRPDGMMAPRYGLSADDAIHVHIVKYRQLHILD
jgi:hypothetical protein